MALTEIQCLSGKTFKISPKFTKSVDFKDFECKYQVQANVRELHETCGQNNVGELKEIGFEVGSPPMFVPLIQVCYKSSTGSAIYSRHYLNGQAVFTGCVPLNHGTWSLEGTNPAVANLPNEYPQAEQKKHFTAVSTELGNRFTDSNYFVKGHLMPYCDALYPNWKWATMFYLNAVPKWRRVNGANWVRIEYLTRLQAKAMLAELEVITGVHGVLQLDGVSLKLMANGYVEVPEYLWKIVRDPSTGNGIALVTLNNVFATRHFPLCEDICTTSRWNSRNMHEERFADYSRGFTICCDVNDLMRTVKNIPESARTNGLLNAQF